MRYRAVLDAHAVGNLAESRALGLSMVLAPLLGLAVVFPEVVTKRFVLFQAVRRR